MKHQQHRAGPGGGLWQAAGLCALAALAAPCHAQAGAQAQMPGQAAAEAPPSAVPALATVTVRGQRVQPAGTGDEGRSGKLPRRASGATKTDTPLHEVPQAISVITAAELRDSGAQTLGQALAYSPGVLAMPSGGNDSARYDFFSLRGQRYNGALFVDGLRASFGTGNLSMPQLDPYLIERVELVRGPSSALYGQGLPGGMVNAISKRPAAAGQARREASLTLGTHQQRALRLDMGASGAQQPFDWRVAALAQSAHNQVQHVRAQRLALAPSLRWQLGARTTFTLLASYQRDPKGGYYSSLPVQGTLRPLPGGGHIPRGFFVGDTGYDRFKRGQATLGYDLAHSFGSGWQLQQSLRYLDAQAQAQALAAAALAPPATLARSALLGDSHTRALLADTRLAGQLQTGAWQHSLLLGLDAMRVRLHQTLGLNLAGVPPIHIWQPAYGQRIPAPSGPGTAMVWSDTRERITQTGLYAQDQLRQGPWLLTLSGRYDIAHTRNQRDSLLLGRLPTGAASRQRDSAFTGRAALAYQLDSAWVAYLSRATSFLPQPGLLADGSGYRPLQAAQWELGLKYAPPAGGISFDAALFDLRQKNALTPDTDPTHTCLGLTGPGPCMVQSARQRTRGLELQARAELGAATFVHASLSLLDARITHSNGADQGKRPVNIPARSAALWLDQALGPQWRLGLGLRHVGATYADAANTLRVPSHTLLDAALHWRLPGSGGHGDHGGSGASLSLRASNLLNRRYPVCDSASYCNWGAARHISAELNYPW